MHWVTGEPPRAGYYLATWLHEIGLVVVRRVSELWWSERGWWTTRGYTYETGKPVHAVLAWAELPEGYIGDDKSSPA